MTSTDICNLALAYIDGRSIQSVDENNETSRKCKLHYDHCRKTTLIDYNWGFAKRQEKLALVSDAVFNDYLYAYIRPEKCLAIRRIYDENDNKETFVKHRYEEFSLDDGTTVIACNVESAYIEYTYDVNDSQVYSPKFIEALACLLSSKLALTLVGNTALQTQQFQLYQMALREARYQTAKEKNRIMEEPSGYKKARWS